MCLVAINQAAFISNGAHIFNVSEHTHFSYTHFDRKPFLCKCRLYYTIAIPVKSNILCCNFTKSGTNYFYKVPFWNNSTYKQGSRCHYHIILAQIGTVVHFSQNTNYKWYVIVKKTHFSKKNIFHEKGPFLSKKVHFFLKKVPLFLPQLPGGWGDPNLKPTKWSK